MQQNTHEMKRKSKIQEEMGSTGSRNVPKDCCPGHSVLEQQPCRKKDKYGRAKKKQENYRTCLCNSMQWGKKDAELHLRDKIGV